MNRHSNRTPPISVTGAKPRAPDGVRPAGRLVEGAQFFQRAQPAQPQGGADRFTYTITASTADKQRTLSLTDPIGDPKVADLVAALRRLMRKQQ